MQVTYNGFTGELVKLELTSVNARLSTNQNLQGPTMLPDGYNYNLSVYDSEKQVTHSFTSVKLEDVKFLGGAVSFGG